MEKMNAAGNRMNANKPKWTLLLRRMAPALEVVARVTEHGAKKYSPDGWWNNPLNPDDTLDSAQRHLHALMAGEAIDDPAKGGSGLPHWAHLAWNALAFGALQLAGRKPKSGPIAVNGTLSSAEIREAYKAGGYTSEELNGLLRDGCISAADFRAAISGEPLQELSRIATLEVDGSGKGDQ